MRTQLLSVLVVTSIVLAGCASNPGVVQISPDTYLLAKSDKAGIFGNASTFKAEVIQEANAYAQAQGKVAIPINLKQTPVAPGRLATIEYQFRVVDARDHEAKRTSLVDRADFVIESNTANKTEIDLKVKDDSPKAKERSSSRDVYSELIKLDDLRKRGVLTDAEFEVQKKKLLSGAD